MIIFKKIKKAYAIYKDYNLKTLISVSFKYFFHKGKKSKKFLYKIVLALKLCFKNAELIFKYIIDNLIYCFLFYEKTKRNQKEVLISIVVPSYNHEKYLRKRLRSIKRQLYSNVEIILLDDCSSDNSSSILAKFYKKHSDICQLIINEKNSGNVFKQWAKGIEKCRGEYIWIAESDDYCSPLFLHKLRKMIQNKENLLVFGRSTFVTSNGLFVNDMSAYLMDTNIDFKRPFKMRVGEFLENGFSWKNIIVNVSSCLIKNCDFLREFIKDEEWKSMSLCGDWILYLNQLQSCKDGFISYSPKSTNYYRIHKSSTSTSVQKTKKYIMELNKVFHFIDNNFNVSRSSKLNLYYYIKQESKKVNEVCNKLELSDVFGKKVPIFKNILFVIYSLTSGGGETFPIFLANQLHDEGCNVAILNFLPELENHRIRQNVNKNIPIIDNKNRNFDIIVNDLGFGIIQTQHASCDYMVAKNLENINTRLVVTNHGMYNNDNINSYDWTIFRKISKFIYIAEKGNLHLLPASKKAKVANGLPNNIPNKISRKSLGIEDDSFVCCTVSRGIPKKGWVETIKAIKIAREKTKINIHYIIVGSGLMYDRLIKKVPNYIHLVGFSNSPRSYILCSDLVILASTFEGESFPLLLIDSFYCGVPVICSDIGETRNMITIKHNQTAGDLIKITNNTINIEELADAIIKMCTNKKYYLEKKKNAKIKSSNYEINKVSSQYLQIYKKLFQK